MTAFTFRPCWLLASLVLLAVEVAIARYAPPGALRGFGGDVLVVVLVYALLRSCVAQPAARLALGALLFACAVECLQGLGMVDVLGLHGQTALHRVLRIALGTTFDLWDLVAYGCGWLVCRALDMPRLVFQRSEFHAEPPSSALAGRRCLHSLKCRKYTCTLQAGTGKGRQNRC